MTGFLRSILELRPLLCKALQTNSGTQTLPQQRGLPGVPQGATEAWNLFYSEHSMADFVCREWLRQAFFAVFQLCFKFPGFQGLVLSPLNFLLAWLQRESVTSVVISFTLFSQFVALLRMRERKEENVTVGLNQLLSRATWFTANYHQYSPLNHVPQYNV